jgi:hypothetical protein
MMNKRHLFATISLVLVVFPCFILGETESNTGLEGVIVTAPIHGGPARIGVPNSGPLANVDFNVKKGDEIVASFRTDDKGQFRISLAPGHYIIALKDGKRRFGRYGPFEADVVAGQIKRVEWTCDSGMR